MVKELYFEGNQKNEPGLFRILLILFTTSSFGNVAGKGLRVISNQVIQKIKAGYNLRIPLNRPKEVHRR